MGITKKSPKKKLEKFSQIFTQLSLVLVLFVVYVTLEHKTERKKVRALAKNHQEVYDLDKNETFVFKKEVAIKPKVRTPKVSKLIIDAKIKKVDNDVVEKVIDLEPTKNIDIIDLDSFDEIDIVETFTEDVDFINIQNAPVFKGCEGLSEKENRKCFQNKIKQFVHRNFNLETATDAGLESGKHRIYTQFIIDNKGDVVDVKVSAKQKALKTEVNRVITKLPKFKPGKQHNQNVKVKYTLPISFKLE